MSSGAPLGLASMAVVFDLCSLNPRPILGGSLALVLLGVDPPSTPIHDIDLVFTDVKAAAYFVAYLNDRECHSVCSYRGLDPYAHWMGELRGVKFCVFVNPEANVITAYKELLLQQPEEILAARVNIKAQEAAAYQRKRDDLFNGAFNV